MMDLRAHPVGRGLHTGGRMFASTPFTLGSPVLSRKSLGETEQSLYVRGKAAVAKYDDLTNRLGKISDKTYRDRVSARILGDPRDPASPIHIRNAVYNTVKRAESDSPVNYLAFSNKPVQEDVVALEGLDQTFEALVSSGESAYGTGTTDSLSGPSLGVDKTSLVCAAAGLVVVGTIVYFAIK
jgi:hypothetical protein